MIKSSHHTVTVSWYTSNSFNGHAFLLRHPVPDWGRCEMTSQGVECPLDGQYSTGVQTSYKLSFRLRRWTKLILRTIFSTNQNKSLLTRKQHNPSSFVDFSLLHTQKSSNSQKGGCFVDDRSILKLLLNQNKIFCIYEY